MTILTESKQILSRSANTASGVTFYTTTLLVAMDEARWHDLGRPDEITVTIEPGDRLNP